MSIPIAKLQNIERWFNGHNGKVIIALSVDFSTDRQRSRNTQNDQPNVIPITPGAATGATDNCPGSSDS